MKPQPWWRKVAKPESMSRPDTRTEKVIERLEIVAERMENVARVLSDDLDTEEEEQRDLHRIVREAQGRQRRRPGAPRISGDENGGSDVR